MDDRQLVFGLLFVCANRLETLGKRYLGELTIKQWFLLAVLDTFFPQPPTIGQLAQKMGSSHQNVKQIALRLQKKGFIRLCQDSRDGRMLRVQTTDRFAAYSAAHGAENERLLSSLFSVFSAEETTDFADKLNRLTAQLKTIEEERA